MLTSGSGARLEIQINAVENGWYCNARIPNVPKVRVIIVDQTSKAVSELARLVGWVGQPKYLPDWRATERLLGHALPEDYKQLLTVMPAGKYRGAFLLSPPTVTGHVGDHLESHRELFDLLRELSDLPYRVYPELPGLLPWGESSSNQVGPVFWLVDGGDPNRWPVVLTDVTYHDWEQFDVGVVEFLIALVKGEVSAASRIVPPMDDQLAYKTYQDLPGAPNNTGR